MPIDYSVADRVLELSFEKLKKPAASLNFPEPGTLSRQFSAMLAAQAAMALPHQQTSMLASAGVEMWHRAIHSFLWSVALTNSSPIWASNTGYYASHFVMRAFSHSMGIFKSFTKRAALQVMLNNGQFTCTELPEKGGEHAFYWKVVKGHPKFNADPLFRENNEREDNKKEDKSDSIHRNYATYNDHLDSFQPLKIASFDEMAERVEQIGRIRRYSVTAPTPQRDDFPDVDKVQILAFQRIVAFHDFLEERLSENRFWRAHRRPTWCKDVMQFQVVDSGLEQPSVS